MSTMDTKLRLAPMTLADLDEVVAIERVSFPTPWTPAAFRYEIQQNRVALCSVMRAGRQVVGYLCLWEIGHEIHITNLAVHPDWRHRGVGRAILLSTFLDRRGEEVQGALELRANEGVILGVSGHVG